MLATAVDKPFSDKEWLFELKLDGFRAIAEIRNGKPVLYSRNGLSMAERFPSVITALKKLKANCILDGEIVLLNEHNKPDFQKLQNHRTVSGSGIIYYVFDLLSLNEHDLSDLPLIERKKLLKKLIRKTGTVRFCDHIEENGIDFFRAVQGDDLEGIMAKKKDSLYTPGVRTKQWLKIKHHKSQEAIIGGFTQPKGSRNHFGSLLLGQYRDGKLKYIGHAGTGFNEKTLRELFKKLEPLIQKDSPFDSIIKANSWATWVKPLLVCEVSYSEITRDGMLRHPVFKRLRDDKKSRMVKMKTERALPVKKLIKVNRQ